MPGAEPKYKIGTQVTSNGGLTIKVDKIESNRYGPVYCGKVINWIGRGCISEKDVKETNE